MGRVIVAVVAALVLSSTAIGFAQEDYSLGESAYGDIFFARGSAALDDKAKTTLDELAKLLSEMPGAMVLLAGYDEAATGRERSIELGWQRARAVREYLVSKGADPASIKEISFGNAKAGQSDKDGAKDRRVRFRVVPPQDPAKEEGKPFGVCQRCKK